MARKATLKWAHDEYAPWSLSKYPDRELRREYTRLRDIIRKRLNRMEKSGDLVYLKGNDGLLPPRLRDLKHTEDIRMELSRMSDFINYKFDDAMKLKAAAIKGLDTLQKNGYSGITKDNLPEFARFMTWYRATQYDKLMTSRRAAKIFSEAKKNGPDRFGLYDPLYQQFASFERENG